MATAGKLQGQLALLEYRNALRTGASIVPLR